MNLILRPLHDVNDVTWSIVWCLLILLAGVMYYIVYIMRMAFGEQSHTSKLSSSYVEEVIIKPQEEID